MSANNYFGFTHGGTQYGAAATGAAYPPGQNAYAVAPAAAATYTTPRPGYDPTYHQAPASQGTYASAGTVAPVQYDYGYGRTAQTYDATKTYYQQAPTTATYGAAQSYDATQTAAKVAGYQTAQYVAAPTRNTNVQPAKPATTFSNQTYVPQTQTVTNVNTAPKQAATTSNTYSNYDAALYSAATMYVAQQTNKTNPGGQANNWQSYKKPGLHPGNNSNKTRMKPQPKPQQLHYCEVCKISCAGPQTYREHLDGQKHKKREASLKLSSSAAAAVQNSRGNNLHCELCDVTCTGNDAYAAHVRGSKHQKVVKLHQKLGKPIPSTDPLAKKTTKINFVPPSDGTAPKEDAATADIADDDVPSEDIKPVGLEYIEEIKDDEGKTLSFNCKLCECKFNDPNAKEMHMKGRRHRLQYKKKVQPDLVVDFKPNPRQRRIAEAKAQRAVLQAEYWNRQRNMGGEDGDDDPMYWDERRRFEDEFDYMGWARGGGFGPRGPHMRGPPPFFGMMPGRRPESSDDRHVVARHAEIYPKEEELQTIQRIVSHTERALKFVSDALTDKNVATNGNGNGVAAKVDAAAKKDEPAAAVTADKDATKAKEDGRDNQMFSFQKDAEGGAVRILKGVMRVGLLAKGLLLQGDNLVELVVLCADKPTHTLLKRVAKELPVQLNAVSEEHKYTVSLAPNEGAVLVTDGTVTVKVSLTSPLLREAQELKPQARATGLQSCVMIMRILRDLCKRKPTWAPLSQWAMELLVEKVISSAGMPLSPGDSLRRVMEATASDLLINGPGILDPCEKEPHDALAGLSKQVREDLCVSSQEFLRLIAFRQIYKVLGMEPLPAPKFQQRPWRFARKRRRSTNEAGDNEGDGKMVKKEGDFKMDVEENKPAVVAATKK
ncbi:Zinc finger RNA-binding protein 2 [Pseudolycoriella hygida]|uniref:Zinc finger RNA-binding protein 2 n=1 Tax=Pseudolycoriella hygida TaxID=35572 RepID=A0A9Q0MN08_9DIPT|nr:Zinc finger RNA-binding protein 2 [Pseudolycoriella hygida]